MNMVGVKYWIATLLAGLNLACATAPWKEHPMSTAPDFTCHFGDEVERSLYVWECLDGKRVVIWQFCAGFYPCERATREEAACGTFTPIEKEAAERDKAYPKCEKKPEPWSLGARS